MRSMTASAASRDILYLTQGCQTQYVADRRGWEREPLVRSPIRGGRIGRARTAPAEVARQAPHNGAVSLGRCRRSAAVLARVAPEAGIEDLLRVHFAARLQ